MTFSDRDLTFSPLPRMDDDFQRPRYSDFQSLLRARIMTFSDRDLTFSPLTRMDDDFQRSEFDFQSLPACSDGDFQLLGQ